MLIFCQHITPRLTYIVKELLGKQVSVTNDKENFITYSGTKFNYSNEQIAEADFSLNPHALLFEQNIQQQPIDVFEWNDLQVFFKTEGFVPFDFLAAAFYLITRYEEYLPHQKDMYGRYAHTNSIAFKNNFLHLPLVNLWLQEIKKNHPSFTISNSSFQYIPTYDIDIAFAYQHKSFFKNALSFFKDLFQLNTNNALEKLMVYANKKSDPFNVYNWLHQLHQQYLLQPRYFFLVAQKQKGYDKNISPQKAALKLLIQHHAEKYKIGIHPSWQSGNSKNILKQEIELLGKIINQKITISRQHYIRMSLPETYQQLIEQNVQEDYSMGYGSINGFRASYCLPFYWYNLQTEMASSLIVYPFCFMEANSFFEQKYSVAQAEIELQQYYNVVKKVGGTLITIFHNHFITEQREWIEWRNLYENFISKNNFSVQD